MKRNTWKSTTHLNPGQSSFDDNNWDASHSFISDATPSPSKWARLEEVQDEDLTRQQMKEKNGWFAHVYPHPVGTPIGEGRMKFETLFEEQKKRGEINWAPFASEEEWKLARWLSQHVGHKAIDEYLKLPIVKSQVIWFVTYQTDKTIGERSKRPVIPQQLFIPQENWSAANWSWVALWDYQSYGRQTGWKQKAHGWRFGVMVPGSCWLCERTLVKSCIQRIHILHTWACIFQQGADWKNIWWDIDRWLVVGNTGEDWAVV